MDFKTASSILRLPWLIDEHWAMEYYEEFLSLRASGKVFRAESDEENARAENPRIKFFASSTVKYAPTYAYSQEAKSFNGFDGAQVAIIQLEGPLMRNDFCGSYGTDSMLNFFKLAAKTESVQQILLQIKSPGGTVDGTSNFADTVKACTKPVTAIVDGMCCSAAYWIASAADEIFATANTDIIGSVGTMMQLRNDSKRMEQLGIVTKTYYATESNNKNKIFTDAQNGDGKMLIKMMLDPMNNEFIGAIKGNRKNIDSEALTGHTYIAKDAKGKGLIEGVKSMDSILSEKIQSKVSTNSSTKKIYNMNVFQKTLTAASATEFTVIDGGFQLSEIHLTNIEAALAASETALAASAAVKAELLTANTALTTANAKIIDLQDRVIAMGKLDGARFSVPPANVTTGADGKVVVDPKPEGVPGAVVVNPHAAYLTSADKMLAEMQAASNPKP